jgi:hypothetical protein
VRRQMCLFVSILYNAQSGSPRFAARSKTTPGSDGIGFAADEGDRRAVV